MASLALFACQDELEVEKATKPGKELLRVSVNIPEYRIATRAASFENNLSDVWLLAFDRNGLFLERVQATELNSGEADGVGSGSFKAEVPEETGIIHVVANYDNWSSFNDNASLQKDEKEVMPSLYGNKMVFWGRSEVTSSSLSVTLFRNQAKVTVQNEKTIDTTDKGTQIDTHWNLLNTLFLDEYDGYLRTRIETSGDVWRICVDYLLDIEETTRQAIYYGSNLLDLTYTEKIPNDFATRITAYGSKTESHGWWIWKKYSTSAIVAVAKNEEAESKYGVVEKIVTVDGDTTEASLQETADKQLKEYKQNVEPSLMIEAFDYKDTGRDLDRLQFLKKTHVVSEPHGIDGWYVCTKTALTLDAPDNKRYEYGLPPRKLTDQQNANTTNQKTIKNQLRGVLSWLNK